MGAKKTTDEPKLEKVSLLTEKAKELAALVEKSIKEVEVQHNKGAYTLEYIDPENGPAIDEIIRLLQQARGEGERRRV